MERLMLNINIHGGGGNPSNASGNYSEYRT